MVFKLLKKKKVFNYLRICYSENYIHVFLRGMLPKQGISVGLHGRVHVQGNAGAFALPVGLYRVCVFVYLSSFREK